MSFRLSLTLILCYCCLAGFSQKAEKKAAESPLFQEKELLRIDLKFNIKAVIQDLDERNERWFELTYKGDDGEPVSVNGEIRVRGNNRSKPNVCPFPPLRMNFKKKGNDENLFRGQDKIKLVTHCRANNIYEDYVIQEYLTYKHYNVLTDYSMRVRLVRINYIDSATNEVEIERYGIFREEDDVLAYRNDMVVIEKPVPVQDYCERETLDLMTVFQYMVGNTDWSVSQFHNIILIGPEDGRQPVAIPYDFDYAGAIATSYAAPNEALPIEHVRQRLFRGFCRQPGTYEKVFEIFNDKKEEIYAVYEDSPYLHQTRKKNTLKYFDKFYDIINNEKKYRREILNACPVEHKHVNGR